MTYRRAHKFWDPILNSEKSKHLTYKNYPFIQANNRFLQTSIFIFRLLNMYQKKFWLRKDIKGLKRGEKFGAENF